MYDEIWIIVLASENDHSSSHTEIQEKIWDSNNTKQIKTRNA